MKTRISIFPTPNIRAVAYLSLLFFLVTGLTLPPSSAQAAKAERPVSAAFTMGNVVVYHVGDGSAALSSAATAVFLDEYITTAASTSPVQSIAMPTTVNGANKQLVASGTATSEGFLTRSSDGRYLIVPGYAAALGTTGITTGPTVPRVTGRVDINGAIDTTTALVDGNVGNARGAASADGSGFWLTTSTLGLRYATLGATTSTQVSTSPTNLRAPNIFGGQLYVSSATGTFYGVSAVGSGLPTTSGQVISLLSGFPTASGPSSYGFVVLERNSAVAGLDTIYVADDRGTASGGGIQKWTFDGTTWTLAYTLTSGLSTGVRGLAAEASGANVILYATTTESSANKLVTVTDTGSSSAFSTLATASTNTAFRGVALAPLDTTPPTVSATTPANGTLYVATNADVTINFNEAVTVSASSFALTCATSGAHTFALTGSGATYTLNPNTDFVNEETCSGTVYASQVADLANNQLAADYTWSFTITPPSVPPTGVGSAAPSAAKRGDTTTLSVLVTPGANPPSGSITVACDLSAIGGSASQALSNGGSGDTYTYAATIGAGAVPDSYNLPCNVADDVPRSSLATIALTVLAPSLTISDVSIDEGDSGTTTFTFVVSLSEPAPTGGVTFDIATANGTATEPGDYTAQTLAGQTIAEGATTYDFSVAVNGDTTSESDEIFYVNLTNLSSNATQADVQGLGTILNDDLTAIHAIQGSGTTSTLVGQPVSIQGIVIGDYQGAAPSLGGFYVQAEDTDADADPQTSEGIFVYSSAIVSVGDLVRVTGQVAEHTTTSSGLTGWLTEISNVTRVQVLSSGRALPTPASVSLPVAALTDWERYEGMQVAFSQDLTVTDTYSLGRYGQVDLSANGRLSVPTNVVAPGPAAIALEDLNTRSRIILDDASTASNPDPVIYPAPALSAANTLRVGAVAENLTGVLDDRYGAYRLQPQGAVNFTAANPRPTTAPSVGGTVKAAGLNMLNYFVTLGAGYTCGPTGGLQCRGASDAAEFTRQRDKLLNVIVVLSPDVAGLMEMENDAGDGAAQDLVNGLNALLGPGTYAYIPTGPIGTDAIRLAIIYKPAVVTPIGSFAVLTSQINPLFLDTKNRPSLAQTFMVNASGAKFTLVSNHLKSKGSDCNDVSDPDTGDGQGNCNLTRTNAATAIAQWLATDPTGGGDPDFLLVGDMNAYALEDPITSFKSAGYTNIVDRFLGAEGYSYVYNGETGYLDHALASATLNSQVAGVAEWHINADEPTVLDYNTEYKSAGQITSYYSSDPFRASDHDPVIIGLDLLPDTTTTVTSKPNPSDLGESVTFTATVTAAIGAPTGAVQFYADDVALGAAQALTDGEATYSTSALGVGAHTITATYSGDANFLPSTSNAYLHGVGCVATVTVTTNAESGPGSLRQGLVDVCAGGVINFDADYTIALASQLVIDKSVTIDGTSHSVTVSGSHATRVFNVTAGNVIFDHLTIANGNVQSADCGASSYKCGGGLRLQNSGVTVTVQNSTLIGNEATDSLGYGGGIANEGGTLLVKNSTFSGNNSGMGGGLVNHGGSLTVLNSTFSGNSASTTGGGIYTDSTGTFTNSIVANNPTGGNCSGTISGTKNLADDASCGVAFTNSPNILLGVLGDNGGPTQTFALLTGSSAINAGETAACPPTDQRGLARPQGAACDIGAYEAELLTITANDKTKVYGDPDPSFDFSTNPIGATFTTPPVCTVTGAHTETGPYPIACTGGTPTDSKYALIYVDGTLTITKATATVALGNLAQTYDGTPKPVSVTTTPPSLTVDLTYAGSATVPTNAGSYIVEATVDEANYQGSATDTLVIAKATPLITFDPAPAPTYPGANFTVHATTANTDDPALTYSAVSGPCTFVSEATFAPTGTGECIVQAAGAETANFMAATQTQTVTIAAGPAVTTNAASAIAASRATLNGLVNANGGSVEATFEYGLTDSYGSSIAATPSPVTGTTDTATSATLTGLTPNTTYHFRAVAGGVYGLDLTFTTAKMIERAKNGSFETYVKTSKIPLNWKALKFGTLDGKDILIKKVGQASVKIVGAGAVTKTLTQTLVLSGSAGDAFALSYWIKGSKLPKTGLCQVQVWLYNGATPAGTQTLKCPALATYAWRKVTGPLLRATKAYNKVVIKITFRKASGTVWFDALSLMR